MELVVILGIYEAPGLSMIWLSLKVWPCGYFGRSRPV